MLIPVFFEKGKQKPSLMSLYQLKLSTLQISFSGKYQTCCLKNKALFETALSCAFRWKYFSQMIRTSGKVRKLFS
jgi:hypothetical protein